MEELSDLPLHQLSLLLLREPEDEGRLRRRLEKDVLIILGLNTERRDESHDPVLRCFPIQEDELVTTETIPES